MRQHNITIQNRIPHVLKFCKTQVTLLLREQVKLVISHCSSLLQCVRLYILFKNYSLGFFLRGAVDTNDGLNSEFL